MRKTFAILLIALGAITATAGGQSGPTNTYISSSPNPAASGQQVTLTASVYPAGCPGIITFMDYGSQVGTAYLDGNGNATMQTSSLGVGTNSITASYDGEGDCDPSTSSALNQVINGSPTTTLSVSSSANPVNYGQPVTLTAQVTPSTCTGTVTFLDGGTSIGTETLNGSGSATLLTSALTVGIHPITASLPAISPCTATVSAVLYQKVSPVITGLSLPQGPAQMGFVITGSGFGSTAGSVTVNGTNATVLLWNANGTSITVQVPANTGASGGVVVTVNAAPSTPYGFTVTGGFGCS